MHTCPQSRHKTTVLVKILFFCLALVIGIGYCSAGYTYSQASKVPIKSAAEIDYPPFSFVDADGVASGFSVELLRAALSAMRRDVTFRTGPWEKVRLWLERGEVQALPLVGRTPEREPLFDFTFPYMSIHGAIVVRKGETKIRNLRDLRGKQVAVMKGDNAEEFLRREEQGIKIHTTATFGQALRELSEGRYAAVVIQRLVALRLIKKLNLTSLQVVNHPIEGFRQDFCFAVKEGDRETLALLNEGLALVMADGTYRHLHAKWFASLQLPTTRRIVIGGDHNYPPFEYLDENGRPAGYNVDLTRAIARALDLDVEIRLGPWSEIRRQLASGEIDAVQGMLYSTKRDLTFDFTPAHTVSSYVSVVRKGEGEPPATLDELKGKRIVVQQGDIMHDFVVDNGLQNGASFVDSQEDALRELAEGKYDVALVARLAALHLIKQHGWNNLLVGTHAFISPGYCFAVPQNQKALLAQLSEGLKLLEANGDYQRINEKWLGVYNDKSPTLKTILLHAAFVLIPLSLLALAFFLWSWSLRRKVAQRTAELRRNEALLNDAQRIGKVGGWEYDVARQTAFWTEETYRIHDIDQSEISAHGAGHVARSLACCVEKDRPRIQEAFQRCVEKGEPYELECRFTSAKGRELWVRTAGQPVFERNRVIKVVGNIQDITSEKIIEQQLRDQNQFIQTILDNLPIGLAVNDIDEGVASYHNKKFEEIYGWPAGELKDVEMFFEKVFPDPAYRDKIRTQVLSDIASGDLERMSWENFEVTGKDGTKKVITAKNIPIYEQNIMISTVQDITEKKKAESALRESEERFRSMAMLLPEIIFETDTKGQITFLNQAAFERIGYSQEGFERGLNSLDMLVPQDRARAAENITKVMAGQELELREYTALTQDGFTFPCLVSTSAIIKDGVPVGLRGFAVDITDRKEIEAALRESEEHFRTAFESAPEGMALIDLNRRFLKVNPRLCEILGYSEDELLGKSFNRFTHPDDRQSGRDRWKELLSGNVSANRAEKRFIHKNGQVIWVFISNAAICNRQGEIQFILSHLYDITERKKTNEALQLSEEKFAKAFKHSPMWVVITSLHEGRYIDVNEAFLKDTGFTREEVIGHTASDLNLRLDPLEREQMERMLLEQGPIHNMEVKRRVRSGEVLDMLLSAEMLPMSGEEAIVAVLADITALKKGQKEKEKLEAQLRRAQKLEAVGTLAGGIAHDFNNMLAAIMGYSELAQDSVPAESESQEYLAQVLNAANRAQKLVKQILTFSRKAEVDTRPLSLNRHVKEAVDMVKQVIPRMVNLELHLDEKLHLINGDGSQLEQILMNLITNANDAMPNGGRLIIETENVFLSEEYCREHLEAEPGDYVQLQISDTGQGMSKDVMNQIFDPFFTTKEAGKGTGLGLSTVYGIVKAHGGLIYCYSEPGQGTTFRIYFPALKAKRTTEAPEFKASKKSQGGDEYILLVDDEEPLRKLGQLLLSREGYHVITAGSGEEALEVYQQKNESIDLIILDVSMPGMGGHNCLVEILKINPQAKVLIASGYSANGQLKDTLAAGASGYIAKPFERAKMLNIVRAILDS